MKNKKYHTVGTVLKYHTVGTVLKYHTVGTVPKSNKKIVERGNVDTSYTDIRNRSLSRLGIGTSINNGGVKLDYAQQDSCSICLA